LKNKRVRVKKLKLKLRGSESQKTASSIDFFGVHKNNTHIVTKTLPIISLHHLPFPRHQINPRYKLFKPNVVFSMDSAPAPQLEEIKQEGVDGGSKKKKKSKKSSFFPGFGCFRIEHDVSGGGFDIEVVDESGQRPTPTHLIIMVNGLVGRFA